MSSVVGIDLGLQNSVIAAAGRGGVDVILNGNSNRLNPSMVSFDQSRKMGESAATGAISNYKNTIKHMKRLVGLSFDDPRAQYEMKLVPFACVRMKHSLGGPPSIGVKVTLNNEETTVSVEAICGMLIKHLGMIAAEKAAASSADVQTAAQLFPQDWVIAVPSYFTDAQRRGLLTGCEIAGINGVQRLIHENTATALAYGIFKDIRKEFTKDKPTNVMFIDMGASAYTVSIAAFEPGKLIIKSSYCDSQLGGRDIDRAIAEWIADKFVEKYKKKLSSTPQKKPKVMLKLLAAAEKAKKTLSPHGVKEASISLECLMEDLDFTCKLKASEYEELCAPYLDRLELPIKKTLEEAKLKVADLESIEIVGGSTRINCVKRKLMDLLGGKTLSTTMNADEAVARGAALQSAILSPRFKVLPYEIVDFQPLPIKIAWDEEIASSTEKGVEVDGDAEGADMPTNSVIMFNRGLSFPIVRRVTLRRNGTFVVSSSYDETCRDFGFVEGAMKEIATFTIKAPPGDEKKVRVNVKQDIHGIISLSSAQMVEDVEEEATEADDGKKDEEQKEEEKGEKKKKLKRTNLEYTVNRPLEWSKNEKVKANEVEVSMANTDRIVQETADMRNELESYIYDMRDKISLSSQLGPYCTDKEKDSFNEKLQDIENWLYEDGFDATKSVYADKLSQLKKFGDPIEFRQAEASARPSAIKNLQKNVEKYKTWLNNSQGDEKYAHITDEEFAKCHAKCDEVSSWVYDMMDKQGSIAQNADPLFTVKDINAKTLDLSSLCHPVMNKPAPKPAPAPAPTPEGTAPMETDDSTGKEKNGEPSANGTKADDNMDVDE